MKRISSRLRGLYNSCTELISNLFGPVGNFSIKFCARFEKNSLKLLAMERELKDKPSFSFRPGGNTEQFSDRLPLLGAQNSVPKFFPNN